MNVDIHYLAHVGKDDPRFEETRTIRHEFSVRERESVTQEEFDRCYNHIGSDDVEAVEEVFARWNAGSGQESEAFARRECEDCDAVFTGAPNGRVDLSLRQHNAEAHENETGHTVAHGTRSLSVGDIVTYDNDDGETVAVACTAFGWEEIDVSP